MPHCYVCGLRRVSNIVVKSHQWQCAAVSPSLLLHPCVYKTMKCLKRPTPEELELCFAIPPAPKFLGLGSWVEHLTAPRDDWVSTILRERLELPETTISKMMQFGAIYTCPVPPPVPDELRDTFDTATLLRMENVRQQAMAATPPQFKYRGPKRLIRDEFVNKDSYVRVHFSPKRFPVYYDVDWTSRLVDIGPEHVVVDKPPLLPVAPTVDNVLESTLNGAASAIQLEESLHITSRLDHATEGLVVLGRTPNFVSKFNALLRESSSLGYKKWYKALTASPPPVGHLMHYVKVRCRQKGTPFFTLVLDDLEQKEQHTVAPDEKALFCELIVHSVTKLSSFLPSLSLQQYHNGEQREAYEVLIELITGRTHQIRAQLSAIGCPLYGDALYVPLACGQTRRRLHAQDPLLEIEDADGNRLLAEADGPIGLQACRMEFQDGSLFGRSGKVVFEAGMPWWQRPTQ